MKIISIEWSSLTQSSTKWRHHNSYRLIQRDICLGRINLADLKPSTEGLAINRLHSLTSNKNTIFQILVFLRPRPETNNEHYKSTSVPSFPSSTSKSQSAYQTETPQTANSHSPSPSSQHPDLASWYSEFPGTETEDTLYHLSQSRLADLVGCVDRWGPRLGNHWRRLGCLGFVSRTVELLVLGDGIGRVGWWIRDLRRGRRLRFRRANGLRRAVRRWRWGRCRVRSEGGRHVSGCFWFYIWILAHYSLYSCLDTRQYIQISVFGW